MVKMKMMGGFGLTTRYRCIARCWVVNNVGFWKAGVFTCGLVMLRLVVVGIMLCYRENIYWITCCGQVLIRVRPILVPY